MLEQVPTNQVSSFFFLSLVRICSGHQVAIYMDISGVHFVCVFKFVRVHAFNKQTDWMVEKGQRTATD